MVAAPKNVGGKVETNGWGLPKVGMGWRGTHMKSYPTIPNFCFSSTTYKLNQNVRSQSDYSQMSNGKGVKNIIFFP